MFVARLDSKASLESCSLCADRSSKLPSGMKVQAQSPLAAQQKSCGKVLPQALERRNRPFPRLASNPKATEPPTECPTAPNLPGTAVQAPRRTSSGRALSDIETFGARKWVAEGDATLNVGPDESFPGSPKAEGLRPCKSRARKSQLVLHESFRKKA